MGKKKRLHEVVNVYKRDDMYESSKIEVSNVLAKYTLDYFSSELSFDNQLLMDKKASKIIKEYLDKFFVRYRKPSPKQDSSISHLLHSNLDDQPWLKNETSRIRESSYRTQIIYTYFERKKGMFTFLISDVAPKSTDYELCEKDFKRMKPYIFCKEDSWLDKQSNMNGLVTLNPDYVEPGLRVVEFSMPDFASPVMVYTAFNTYCFNTSLNYQ